MKHGCFLAGTAIVALLGLVVATPAGAIQGTTPSGLVQDVNVNQSSTQAGQPTEAIITTTLHNADNTRPSETVGITVQLPAGMTRNTDSFATCDPAILFEGGCPGSLIGTGSALYDAGPLVTSPLSATLDIYNGTAGNVLLEWAPQQHGPLLVFEGQPTGSSTIEFVIPPILTLPSVPNGAITQLTLDFAPGYLTNPPSCPVAGWTWGFAFAYANGETMPLSVNLLCTGDPSPPTGNGKNRAKACKAERAAIGTAAFREKYGTNKKGSNAFGKCVVDARRFTIG
jgi:hypothetical protein